jgi:hypothetical protein
MRRLLLALLLVAGCSRHSSGRSFVPRAYPDGADGLKQLWSDILTAAKNDERERVHDLMATTFMSDPELRRLLGAKAEPLLSRYHQLMGTLVNRGAVELVAQVYEHKYDTIDVITDENDAGVTAALAEPHPLWSVRVRKATETRGLRYDCFLYLDGKWRTGNQLGKFIEVVPNAAASPSPVK